MCFLKFSFFLLTMGTERAIHSCYSESSQVPVQCPILHSHPWLHATGMLRECLPCSQWVTLYPSPHRELRSVWKLWVWIPGLLCHLQNSSGADFCCEQVETLILKRNEIMHRTFQEDVVFTFSLGKTPSLLKRLCINHRMRLCKRSEICGIGLLHLWVLHLQTQLIRDRKHLCMGVGAVTVLNTYWLLVIIP